MQKLRKRGIRPPKVDDEEMAEETVWGDTKRRKLEAHEVAAFETLGDWEDEELHNDCRDELFATLRENYQQWSSLRPDLRRGKLLSQPRGD